MDTAIDAAANRAGQPDVSPPVDEYDDARAVGSADTLPDVAAPSWDSCAHPAERLFQARTIDGDELVAELPEHGVVWPPQVHRPGHTQRPFAI